MLFFPGVRKSLDEQFARPNPPFLHADYRAGRAQRFGSLSLNREGIIAGNCTLFWKQVADIALVKERSVMIYQAGAQRETWLSLPAFKGPNPGLLLALYRRMRSGQSEQETGVEALAEEQGLGSAAWINTLGTVSSQARRILLLFTSAVACCHR